MKEAGLPEYNLEFWYVFAPVGTPPDVVKKVYDATVTAMRQPRSRKRWRDGTEVSLSASPEQFNSFLAEDSKFWVNLVKSATSRSTELTRTTSHSFGHFISAGG